MSSAPAPSQFCPPEITAAAGPLRAAGDLLQGLSREHRRVAAFGESAADPRVTEALADFVEAWDLSGYHLVATAHSLAHLLEIAGELYAHTEEGLARAWLAEHPDHEGRRR